MLHHHHPAYINQLQADRRAAATRRRAPAEPNELESLVAAATAGDARAWSRLHERFEARVRAVARAHRLGPADVEDVSQNTWLRLLENIGSVRDPKCIGAWIETTARRESLRLLQSAKREHPTPCEELPNEPVEPVAEQRVMAAGDRTAIRQALDRLPHRQRRLLRMLFADVEPSYEEISRSLDMPIGSLGPTRARGLARLRSDKRFVVAVRGAE